MCARGTVTLGTAVLLCFHRPTPIRLLSFRIHEFEKASAPRWLAARASHHGASFFPFLQRIEPISSTWDRLGVLSNAHLQHHNANASSTANTTCAATWLERTCTGASARLSGIVSVPGRSPRAGGVRAVSPKRAKKVKESLTPGSNWRPTACEAVVITNYTSETMLKSREVLVPEPAVPLSFRARL